MKQYDIKPPENPLEQMLHTPKSERGNVLEKKLAQKGALNDNKLETLDKPKFQDNEEKQSLANMLGAKEKTLNKANKKRKKRKHKKRSLLPFHRKNKPIKKLGKKAKHIAVFLGLFAFPITLLVLGIGMFLFIGAALNYAHQVEVISTLASPKYYAEMGARGILGGTRKITDIPQDLIGQEPDLSVDYSHNHAMKATNSNEKVGSVGNIKDSDDKYQTAYKVAQGCAKLLPGVKPDWIFAQEIAEFPTNWNKDRNFTGIKWASSWSSFLKKGHYSTGTSAPGNGDDGQYVHSPSWAAYCRLYAAFLKGNGGRYSKAVHAKSLDEFATGLIDGGWMQDSSTYRQNMHAGAKMYQQMKANGGKMKGAPITVSGNNNSNETVMYGNGTKKVDPSDVTTKTGSLNDSNPHRTKRLLYFYSKRFAGSGNNNSSSTEVIKGGGLTKLMKIVHSLLGIPYVWGGAHGDLHSYKKGMDCSGLINVIWWKAGLGEHHLNTVGWEDQCSQYVSKSELQPGDLLFWGSKGSSTHIALYLGHNKYVQEPEPGQNCEIRPLSWNPYSFAKRNTAMHNYIKKHATIIKKKNGKNVKSSGKYNPNADELWIITRESHGDPHAQNPSSAYGTSEHAYGIGQLLPSWYKKYTPGKDWKNSKAVQLEAMRKYIKDRYGTSAKAKAFWLSRGWY